MDSQATDLFRQIMTRLNHAVEQLDSQSRRQTTLDERLSEIATMLEQEKIFMRDQLREAQNGILGRFTDLQKQISGTSLTNPLSVPIVMDKLDSLEQKTDVMRAQITETAQKCHNLARSTSRIENLLENNNLETSVTKILSIPDTIRAEARAEFVWMNAQLDQKLFDIDSGQGQIIDLLVEHNQRGLDVQNKLDEVAVSTRSMQTLMETGDTIRAQTKDNNTEVRREQFDCSRSEVREELQAVRELMVQRFDEVHTELERCVGTVNRATDTARDGLLEHMTNSDVTHAHDCRIHKVEIEQVSKSISSFAENLDALKKTVPVIVSEIEGMEASLNVQNKTIIADLLSLKEGQGQLTTQVEQFSNELKDDVYRCKREIFAGTEVGNQIIRERMDQPLPSHGKYTFFFNAENFKTLIRSGTTIRSLSWLINEVKSCVQGLLYFHKTGLAICFMNAIRVREVGLAARSNTKVKVKATMCDIMNKVLPDLDIGETIVDFEGMYVSDTFNIRVGMLSCDDVRQKGYGDKEGYANTAVLIRYDVTVL